MEKYSKEYWEDYQEKERLRMMEVGKFVTELNEWIEDDECYAEAAAEIVDEYCQELAREEGMSIPVDQYEGPVEDHWSYVWTDKATKLIEQEVSRWVEVGKKYWPDGDIDIWQHLTQYKEL